MRNSSWPLARGKDCFHKYVVCHNNPSKCIIFVVFLWFLMNEIIFIKNHKNTINKCIVFICLSRRHIWRNHVEDIFDEKSAYQFSCNKWVISGWFSQSFLCFSERISAKELKSKPSDLRWYWSKALKFNRDISMRFLSCNPHGFFSLFIFYTFRQ